MKWNKEGGGWGARLNDNQVVYVEKNTHTEWVWFAVDEAKRSHEAEGYASTKTEAQRCAAAVATALGWVNAEAKPERELVAEWWEVQSRILGMGPWFSVRNGRCVSKTTAMAVKDQCGRGEYRIVHVRRYGVKKGKVKL